MAGHQQDQHQPKDSLSREYVEPRPRGAVTTEDQRQVELERAFAAWVDTPAAKPCLDALKAWYIHSIYGADATNEQLRYREGQRSVIGVIETYAERGRNHGRTGGGKR